LAGWIMARAGRAHNAWAVAHLDLQPQDCVLEVGCGPGVALGEIAERAVRGRVAGLDPSAVMLQQARRRNAVARQQGRMTLQQGTVAALPYADHTFDKVLSVNNIMLWPDIDQGLHEIRRVLKPGGRTVIAVQPRWVQTRQAVAALGAEIAARLAAAEFTEISVELQEMKPIAAVAVTGRLKPGCAPYSAGP